MRYKRIFVNKQILKFLKLSLILFLTYSFAIGQNKLSIKDITVLEEPADTMMKSYLTRIVDRQFAFRDSILTTLKSARDWELQSQTIRDSLISWTGSFPDRTPLKARITGRIERDEYTVEKILFESRPNYLVSANLYLPKGSSSPRPAVLNVLGHFPNGKTARVVQLRSISQAKKGFVALTIDCLGQGERHIDEFGPRSDSPSIAHTIIGNQAFISGTHVFNLMVWDAIRSIDYLCSRPEVDANKICITGCSGGGMMTTYILPFENRIAVAVPACNPGTWSQRVHSNLSADSEQLFFGCFASAVDPRGDPLFTQVPKPLLIDATANDPLNPPRGVWELNTWLFKSYSAHDVPEKVNTSMVEAGHGYNKEQREVANSWMLRWTGGDAEDFWEKDTLTEKEEDLWATNNGSIYNEPGSRGPQELVWEYLAKHKAKWAAINTQEEVEKHKIRMGQLIQELLHTNFKTIRIDAEVGESRYIEDVKLRKFILNPESGIIIPGILLEPKIKNSNQDVVLYISEKGKSELLENPGILADILKEGYRVCAIDLRGIGETVPDMAGKHWDFLSGKPIFGQRVRDILTTVKWLKESEIKAQKIKLWSKGMGALYCSFAGVLCDDISGLVLESPLISFESIVQVKIPGYRNEVVLPGILEKFDMPQVYQALSPRSVTVLNPLMGDKTRAGKSDIEIIDKSVATTYRGLKKQNAWSIQNAAGDKKRKLILGALTEN